MKIKNFDLFLNKTFRKTQLVKNSSIGRLEWSKGTEVKKKDLK